MMLLSGCFIAAMLFLLAVAEYERDEDTDGLWDEVDRRAWVDYLAKRSLREQKRSRSRYSKSGQQ